MNHWTVEYSCGCAATATAPDAPPNYCPAHGRHEADEGTKEYIDSTETLIDGGTTI
jgi:hypothetical protein